MSILLGGGRIVDCLESGGCGVDSTGKQGGKDDGDSL